MREEVAPYIPPPEAPVERQRARGWLGRAVERLLTVAVAAGLFYGLFTGTAPRKRTPIPAAADPAAARPAAAKGARGLLAVPVPDGADPGALRVSILASGGYATPEKDRVLRLIPIEELAETPLPTGRYMAVFSYRDQVLPGISVTVQASRTQSLKLPREALARIEYETAIARQSAGENDDIQHLKRVVALQPGHVEAHLQLAAHALASGSRQEAEHHLQVVDRKDPGNPHAAKIARVMARMAPR